MVSAAVCRQSAAAKFWPAGGQRDASVFPPESAVSFVVKRLKNRPEFLRVAGAGRKWVTPGLILQARRHDHGEGENAEVSPVRVGLTVSRKVGNAVKRNRARRRLRAAVEQVISDHAENGHDFVVIGRTATLDRPFAALLNDLETALKRLNAYR